MDELHASLVSELAAGGTSLPVAMDMALVARFYERLGDHAVNIGERVRYLADPTSTAAVVSGPPAVLSARP
jgi:phosphate transport system protein